VCTRVEQDRTELLVANTKATDFVVELIHPFVKSLEIRHPACSLVERSEVGQQHMA